LQWTFQLCNNESRNLLSRYNIHCCTFKVLGNMSILYVHSPGIEISPLHSLGSKLPLHNVGTVSPGIEKWLYRLPPSQGKTYSYRKPCKLYWGPAGRCETQLDH
jgi:hypothetical protein